MKVVIAPDSFKGSLSAIDVCLAVQRGIDRVDPAVETVLVPMADGGEGTVACLVHVTGGTFMEASATDPLGRRITSQYGVLGDGRTCVIEVAAASGLPLLRPEEYNPLRTTSYGTGELIRDALDRGYRKFVLGLGGSATNDMGAGLLQALGARLLKANGEPIGFGGGALIEVASLDLSEFDDRIQESEFIIASDVTNPLVGPDGASAVFGPQKGASADMIPVLDRNLHHFADVIERTIGVSLHHYPGAGAAGGIGAVCHAFFPGRFERGINLVMQITDLQGKLRGASLVITGEGKMDDQTKHGKVPYGVAKMAKRMGIPTIAMVGSVEISVDAARTLGLDSVVSIVPGPMLIEEATKRAFDLLTDTAERIFRIYMLSR
ncbi:MAG: glycerate kinase [Alicyclobacillus sp.]|nr:glycerate kinase [Alicyclobacillus sp.]